MLAVQGILRGLENLDKRYQMGAYGTMLPTSSIGACLVQSLQHTRYSLQYTSVQYSTVQHRPSVPVVRARGYEKKGTHVDWSNVLPEKTAPVTETTWRTTGPVPADSRQ